MRQRRPYRALEIIVIDVEIETSGFVAIDESTGVALSFGAKSEAIQILHIGKSLEWIPAGEVVLETSHRRNGQRHVRHLANLGRPRTGSVDENAACNTPAVVKSNRLHGPVRDIDSCDAILHEHHAERLRLASESLQEAARVAPSITG